jgi:hypothetical protein
LIAAAATVGAGLAPLLLLAAWPPAQPPRPWTVLPGWAYVADGLSVSLAAVLLLAAGTALATRPLTGAAGGRARAGAGWALLLLALGQAVFAAGLGGRWLGLEIAGPALWLLAPGTPRPLTLLRHLAGYPLLAVALSGLLDATPAPGQVIPAIPAWVVIALLVSALVRVATFLPLRPLQNPKSKIQDKPIYGHSSPATSHFLPPPQAPSPKSLC